MKLWRNQPDHDNWRKPFTSRERAYLWLGFSGVFCLLALSEWLHPQQPLFSGKLSWLYSLAYTNFGSMGIFGLMLVISVLLLIAGVFRWFDRGS
jgi:predicted membrane metal-binding protein